MQVGEQPLTPDPSKKPDPRARPGQPRDRHKERLARPEYDRLRATLAEAMGAAGITQRDLSRRMHMPTSFINKLIKGSRALEVTELIDIASAVGMDPTELFASMLEQT